MFQNHSMMAEHDFYKQSDNVVMKVTGEWVDSRSSVLRSPQEKSILEAPCSWSVLVVPNATSDFLSSSESKFNKFWIYKWTFHEGHV